MCHDPLWLKFIESFTSHHPHVAHVLLSLILFDLSLSLLQPVLPRLLLLLCPDVP